MPRERKGERERFASDVVGNGEKSEMDLDAEVKAGRGGPCGGDGERKQDS